MAWQARSVQGLEGTTRRLAELLTTGRGGLADPTGSGLVFEPSVVIRPLDGRPPPADTWAVDGGQATVADARCLQLVVTRAATVRWRHGACVLEDEGELRPHLLGLGEERRALAALRSPVAPGAPVDVNLLRDWAEWEAVSSAVDAADPGAVVLVDGDLQPDWRIPAEWVAGLLERAAGRGVTLVAVTKHSSLARGGAPLVSSLEAEAEAALGPRACWSARVATTRPELGPGLAVHVARLDPDARFAFRVDLPADADAETVLGAVAGWCDDAAFPGYPYPLSVADRLAACPDWVRDEVRAEVEDGLVAAGVAAEVVERAFTDRHRLMERA